MRLRVVLIVGVLFVASLAISSCFVTSRLENVEISCDQFNENPHGITDEFQTHVGDKITMKLCSNPTTDFRWTSKIVVDNVVKEEDHDFEEPGSGDLVGVAGKEIWTFEAVGKGTTELRMEYSRPEGGGEQAEWKYTVTVTVQ